MVDFDMGHLVSALSGENLSLFVKKGIIAPSVENLGKILFESL